MMDINKMREELEAWQAKETPGSDLLRIGNNEESYRNMYVAERWIGWRASRESLVVDVPASYRSAGSKFELLNKQHMIDALTALGIRTK